MALPLQSLELHESHIGLAKKFVLPPHPLTPPPLKSRTSCGTFKQAFWPTPVTKDILNSE